MNQETQYIQAAAFDLDGNLFFATTHHTLENIDTGEIKTYTGDEVRALGIDYKSENATHIFPGNSVHNGYLEMGCMGGRGFDGLYQDLHEAFAAGKMGPSFEEWKHEYLIKGNIWSIITARQNSSQNMQRVIQSLNKEILSIEEQKTQLQNIRSKHFIDSTRSDSSVLDYYFTWMADYYSCYNPMLVKTLGMQGKTVPQRKTIAMKCFMGEVERKIETVRIRSGDESATNEKFNFSFSDDDLENVLEMAQYLKNEASQYSFIVFYTGKKEHWDHIEDSLKGFTKIEVQNKSGNEILKIIINASTS